MKRRLKIFAPATSISKQGAPEPEAPGPEAKEPKDRRQRLPVPVIRTGRPATLHLTNDKIDEILFG